MKKCIAVVIALITCFSSQFIFAQGNCDAPNDPELTRIYFGNGMFNDNHDIAESKNELRKLIGVSPNYDYGIALNPSEPVLLQLLDVYKDKKFDTTYFWNWLTYLDDADAWFQEAYNDAVAQYTESSIDDTYLFLQINQYERDLQSGKKVVIVSHSQGNFYANNAYNYIVSRNPQYQNSIGIVAVGTPASYVAGSNRYTTLTEDVYYTTNASDLLMNGVRALFIGTLPPNPTTPYDQPGSILNHNFVGTYINGFGGRIKIMSFKPSQDFKLLAKSLNVKVPQKSPSS